eukprot:6627807-Alexandrium_andersonii.AAC.1
MAFEKWPVLQNTIPVLSDARVLGAHLSFYAVRRNTTLRGHMASAQSPLFMLRRPPAQSAGRTTVRAFAHASIRTDGHRSASRPSCLERPHSSAQTGWQS